MKKVERHCSGNVLKLRQLLRKDDELYFALFASQGKEKKRINRGYFPRYNSFTFVIPLKYHWHIVIVRWSSFDDTGVI